MVLADSGEDGIIDCLGLRIRGQPRACRTRRYPRQRPGVPVTARSRHPDARTIDDLTALFGCLADRFIKTLIYLADGKLVAALVLGDRDLNE